MKTLTLEIIKKGRVWIACKNEKGYPCKLKLCELSKDLEVGKHDLLVEDISVRSKYGIDLKYSLKGKLEEGICTFVSNRFNSWANEKCKSLGGKWDHEEKVWIFSSMIETEVEGLEEKYNGEEVAIEIKAIEGIDALRDSITFLGYPIVIATGKKSGALLANGVFKVEGTISSGGSVENWRTYASKGSIFRLKVSKYLLENCKNEDFEVKIIN